ncbi:MAG: MFS transporter, partial [Gammaproteobacteria bacterium]|nr:MFS transporter [Gammaproteobacteria bacterium]
MWAWLNALPVGSLILLIALTSSIPETPRYLQSIGDKQQLINSLIFYKHSTQTQHQVMKQMYSHSFQDWDHNHGLFALKLIRHQQPHQLEFIKTVVICEIASSLVMSNLLFFLSTAILTGALGVDAAQAQVETLGIFLLGFIFSLISYRCREFVQRRNFRLSCLGIAILCTAGLMVMSFLHK